MAAKSKRTQKKPNRPRPSTAPRQAPSTKRAKRLTYKQAQIEAEAAARRRAHRRRRLTTLGVIVGATAIITLVVLFAGGDDGEDVATDDSTTIPTAVGSAAGKPCVAVADPLPAGAPAVPVDVGPPPTALVIRDLVVGDGPEIAASSSPQLHYIGVSCSTGRIFDSSYSRSQTSNLPLGGYIPGWQQGVPGMKVGGQRLLGIPPELSYGADGRPPLIAPDETLWFLVEAVAAG